jgi:hypothetical protein
MEVWDVLKGPCASFFMYAATDGPKIMHHSVARHSTIHCKVIRPREPTVSIGLYMSVWYCMDPTCIQNEFSRFSYLLRNLTCNLLFSVVCMVFGALLLPFHIRSHPPSYAYVIYNSRELIKTIQSNVCVGPRVKAKYSNVT